MNAHDKGGRPNGGAFMKRCATGALYVVLAGCAVGPNYREPQRPLPVTWNGTRPGVTVTNAVTVTEWWMTFHDPELNSLVERAAAANHDVRIAEGRLREARALRGGAVWDFGPTVTAAGSYTDSRRSANAQTFTLPRLHTDLYDARFDAAWEIDIFGGQRRALQSATAQFRAI